MRDSDSDARRPALGVGRDRPRRDRTQRRSAPRRRRTGRGVGGGEGRRLRARRGRRGAHARSTAGADRAVRGAGAGGRRAPRRRHRRTDPGAQRAAAVDGRRSRYGSGRSATVYSVAQLDALAARGRLARHRVHLKIDTGMHRVGVAARRRARAGRARSSARRQRCGSTACSPTSPSPTSRRSVHRHAARPVRRGARVDLPAPASIRARCTRRTRPARSPARGAARRSCAPASRSTASHPGRASSTCARDAAPGAVAARARVAREAGARRASGISYGLRHTFDRDTTVATVPIGYADGVPRRLFEIGGEVLVGGRRRPIVGVVTMDQLMVDCGDDDGRGRRRGGADRRQHGTASAITGPRTGPSGSARSATRSSAESPSGSAVATAPSVARLVGSSTRCCSCAPPRSPTTHAIAAALAGLARPGDLIVLAGRDGRRQDRVRPGLRRGARRHRPITSPTFTLVHSLPRPGRAHAAPRRSLPARPHRRGRRPRARRAGRDRRRSCSSSGATSCERCRRPPAWCTSSSTSTTTTTPTSRRRRRRDAPTRPVDRVGRRRSRLGAAVGDARPSRRGGVPMLILGIETATERVSVAIGGHEGVLGLFEMYQRSPPRRDAHAGDRVRLPPGRHRARRDQRDRGRRRARAVHRHARRARRGQGDGAGAAHPDDRHVVARPARVPAAPHRPRHRRRDRRPQGRGVLRVLPTGARRRAAGASSRGRAASTT